MVLLAVLRIANYRQVSRWQRDKVFWAMWCIGVKKQRIARLQVINIITMSIFYFSIQHVDRFYTRVLECWKNVRFIRKCYKVWFHDHPASIRSDVTK